MISWSENDRKAIRGQLELIVRSGPFVQSRRRQRFLEYIVHETLAGRGERLKGYSVALEVFGRPETFDPVANPIVRIEAGRLREKLRHYYATDGMSDPIRIELPRGTYKLHIEFRHTSHGLARHVVMTPDTFCIREGNTRDGEAHDALLTGLGRFWRTREACAEAQQYFAQAVEFDPQYAAAHAGLARTYVWQSCMNWIPAASAIESALEHACRAIEIDDRLLLGHSVLGKVRLYLKDGQGAVSEAGRACALDPNCAEAKMFLSFILAAEGRGADALRNIETAMLLQPHPSSTSRRLASAISPSGTTIAPSQHSCAESRSTRLTCPAITSWRSPMACAGAPRRRGLRLRSSRPTAPAFPQGSFSIRPCPQSIFAASRLPDWPEPLIPLLHHKAITSIAVTPLSGVYRRVSGVGDVCYWHLADISMSECKVGF